MNPNHFESVAANSGAIKDQIDQKEEVRISLDGFLNNPAFSAEEIEQDKKKVEEKTFRIKEGKEIEHQGGEEFLNTARIAEHIITESIGEGGWFGDDVNMILPSLYDDYFRGVDAIAEFAQDKNDPKHMALSMDFTIQKDAQEL